MDFVFTEEQRMLADSLRRLVTEQWTLEQRRQARTHSNLDTAAWNALAEVGVLGLTIPPEHDGFGEDPASLLPVHYELGRGLVGEPVIPSSVISAAIIQQLPNAQAHLSNIASGASIFTVADQSPADAPCLLTPHADTYHLSGTQLNVWHGSTATHWIVRAHLPNGEPALILLPNTTSGVQVHDAPTFDNTRCATLTFNHVPVNAEQLIATGDMAQAAYLEGQHWGIAALCAHASGAMDRLIEITLDYLRVRKQFGVALADFQVLQHALADMEIAKEMALSMAYVAVAALTESNPTTRQEKISSAKIEIARAGRLVGQKAVQLHGGMGMTDELEVGDFFKRLTAIEFLLGDTNHHLAILATLGLDDEHD